ncbi:MAG: InlB B-repeat-containing protein [Propionibacteriaceae bacterium]|jgi:uncharacterized repeat protein (TIGR02543 family)|nr:InlB B-repeat-containing protein [Propionibacteriaceae bacterium]
MLSTRAAQVVGKLMLAFAMLAAMAVCPQVAQSSADPQYVTISFVAEGATAPDPIQAEKGLTLGDVTLPLATLVSRPNYIPKYWSLSSGGAEAPLDYVLNDDVTLYMKWQGVEGVPYQVVYWVEKPNLGVNFTPRPGNPEHYDYAYSEPIGGSGVAGSLIGGPGIEADIEITSIPAPSYFDKEDPMHWASWQATETTTLTGDGLTIVNVYCELKTYQINFPVDPDGVGRKLTGDGNGDGKDETYDQNQPYTLDFKFGENVAARWPHPSMGWEFSDPTGLVYSYWEHPELAVSSGDWQTTRTDITVAMMPTNPDTASYTLKLYWTDVTESVTMHYWGEELDEQKGDNSFTRRDYQGTTYVLLTDYTAAIPPTTDFRSKTIPGFQAGIQGDTSDTTTGPAFAALQDEDGKYHKYINHYYRRLVNSVYFDTRGHGDAVATQEVPFGASLKYLEGAARQTKLAGWTFKGWYADSGTTLSFDFDAKMPAHDLTIYARWESTDWQVTFVDEDGTPLADDGTQTQGVQNLHTINFANLTIGGKRYVARETNDPAHGALEGWDYKPAPTSPKVAFNADTPLQGDITLYARWKSEGLTIDYHTTGGTLVQTDDAGGEGYRNGTWAVVADGSDSYCSTGRHFVGWRIDGVGAVFLPGAAMQVFGEPHLYPYCPVIGSALTGVEYVKADKYIVSFLDGYGQVFLSRVVEPGQPVEVPTPADLASMAYPGDKIFESQWTPDGSEVFNFGDPIESNLTLQPVLHDTVTIIFFTQGTPVEPLRVRKGASAYEVAIPDVHSIARDGYTPNFWSVDGPTPLPADYQFKTDTTLSVNWTAVPNGLPYQVVYWVEKPNLGVNFTPVPGNPDHYDFAYAEPAPRWATAGQTIGGPDADIVIDTLPSPVLASDPTKVDVEHPLRWAYWQQTETKTLDGTKTVINVYAALRTYSYTMTLSNSTDTIDYDHDLDGEPTTFKYKFTLVYKFGEQLGKRWPHPDNGAVFHIYQSREYNYWKAPGTGMASTSSAVWQTPRTVVTAAMMPSNPTRSTPIVITLVSQPPTSGEKLHLRYWTEETPEIKCGDEGVTCRDWNGFPFILMDSLSTNVTPSGSYAAKALEGLTPVDSYGDWAETLTGPGSINDIYTEPTEEELAAGAVKQRLTTYRHFYYTRNEVTLRYDMRGEGEQLAPVPLKYGYSLAQYGGPAPDVVNEDGSVSARFRGWYADANLTLPFNFNTTIGSTDVTVFAKWESTDHLITFRDADGSALAVDDSDTQGVADGGTVDFNSLTIGGLRFIANGLNDPIRGLFTGWDYEPSFGGRMAFPTGTKIYQDYTLYARWKTSGLFVYYHNPNGALLATDTGVDAAGYSQGTMVAARTADDLEVGCGAGQSFIGWRVGGIGAIYAPGSSFKMYGEPHLYPFCLAPEDSGLLVTLTYASNTGVQIAEALDSDQDGVTDPDYLIVRGNNPNTLTAPEVTFTRVGYKLVGWNTCADPSTCENPKAYALGQAYAAGAGAQQTLYAQWEELYTRLAYEASPRDYGTVQGVEGGLAKARHTEDVAQVTGVPEGATAVPAAEGYLFMGWYLGDTLLSHAATFVPEKPETDVVWQPTVYTAKFVPIYFKVTFILHLPDGSTEETVRTVAYREPAAAPNIPIEEGYTFTGWDNAFGMITEDTVVHGFYIERTFTVKFVDHDGTVLDTQIVGFGKDAVAPEQPFWAGHFFTGWDKEFTDVKSNLIVYALYDGAQPTPTNTPSVVPTDTPDDDVSPTPSQSVSSTSSPSPTSTRSTDPTVTPTDRDIPDPDDPDDPDDDDLAFTGPATLPVIPALLLILFGSALVLKRRE